MKISPRILLTNDDGVDAPGMAVMRAIAAQLSDDVWVVAPAANQSGTGHRFTFGYEIEVEKRGDKVFALDGTPADCIVAGITHVLKDRRPDVVLSGVNRGQNLGDILHCSGTVAGAREGALHGALGIALSQAMDYAGGQEEPDFACAIAHAAGTIQALFEASGENGPGDIYFNVNFPVCAPHDVSGIRLVPHQRFARSPFELYPSDNPGKHFLTILNMPKTLDADGDFHILHEDNAITVTPLLLQQTDMDFVRRFDGKLPFEAIGKP